MSLKCTVQLIPFCVDIFRRLIYTKNKVTEGRTVIGYRTGLEVSVYGIQNYQWYHYFFP